MTTVARSALRSKVQTFVRDTVGKKWSTDDLNMFINMAIVQWTTDVPIASSTPYDVVAEQHAYDLPGNATCAYFVRGYFENTVEEEILAPMQLAPGTWLTNNEPRRYVVGYPTDSQLYLPRLPLGTSFTLHYGAVHGELDDDNDTLDLRLHRWGEQAVVAYACYLAHLPYAASRARLRQYVRRPELDTGNPMEREAENWLERYKDLLQEHAQPSVWEFVRLGRT